MAGSNGKRSGASRSAGGQASGQQQFARFIQSAEIPTRGEDWGARSRGQGKRVGGRMVVGAMASVPTGVKQYPDFTRARGVTPSVLADLKVLPDEAKRALIGALQAGWSEKRALRLAYRYGT